MNRNKGLKKIKRMIGKTILKSGLFLAATVLSYGMLSIMLSSFASYIGIASIAEASSFLFPFQIGITIVQGLAIAADGVLSIRQSFKKMDIEKQRMATNTRLEALKNEMLAEQLVAEKSAVVFQSPNVYYYTKETPTILPLSEPLVEQEVFDGVWDRLKEPVKVKPVKVTPMHNGKPIHRKGNVYDLTPLFEERRSKQKRLQRAK